ncbi:amino acid ABC transporter permease [Desulfocurvus sp. DL9XJH121]
MRKKTVRFTALDAALLAALTAGAALFAWRVEASLDYQWRWGLLAQYLVRADAGGGGPAPGLILQGLFTTLRLSVWVMVLALGVGALMGLARCSARLFPRLAGRTYVELVRNTPPLVLIFIFYFFLADQIMAALHVDELLRAAPDWVRDTLAIAAAPVDQMPNFLAALLTMAVYEGAFIAEHVRAGVQSVERGQLEAAYALGLTRLQRMRHVILPQALTRMVPPLAGQFVSIIKDTAIVSVISVQELTFQGMELMAATYMTFEIMIAVTLLYLALTLACSTLARRLELRLRQS